MGGSVGMSGAPALASLAALRSGAGLVVVAVPKSIQPIVATLCPCATTIGLPETSGGQIQPAATLTELISRGLCGANATQPPDSLVIGMGLGRGDREYARGIWWLIDAFREEARVATVVDADALNLARRGEDTAPEVWNTRAHPRTIFTPHPGELAHLLGISAREVQEHREARAMEVAGPVSGLLDSGDRGVVVLKGAGTIVTDARRIYTNTTGNPGMGTGGTGDVLGGVIAALLAQKQSLMDAAMLGVYVHGLAGDLGAKRLGQASLIATDVIDSLPNAFLATARRKR